jgi:hypothetical protein
MQLIISDVFMYLGAICEFLPTIIKYAINLHSFHLFIVLFKKHCHGNQQQLVSTALIENRMHYGCNTYNT